MGKQYLILMLLITLLYTHIHHDLSFFGVNNAGTAHGLVLSLIKPLSTKSSTCLLSSTCSVGFIRLCGKFVRFDPGARSIACWMSHISGNLFERSSRKTSLKLLNHGGDFQKNSVIRCFNHFSNS